MAQFMQIRAPKVYKKRRNTDPHTYKQLYRFEAHHVRYLADTFLGNTDETKGGALSRYEKMEIFLRYVGDPGFQTGVGEDKGVHQSTVSRTVREVARKICQKSNNWIIFPTNIYDIDQAKREWQAVFNFPCCIGALDCTHVEIIRPSVQGDEYVNRKNRHSINVQATCNSKEIFTSVDATSTGSTHDSRVLRKSGLIESIAPYRGDAIIIADAGYGLSPWLMTPYKNPANDMQRNYNQVHAWNRVIIERVFGQVKRRFPLLSSQVRLCLDIIPSVIISCFVLHNVAKHINDRSFDDEAEGADINADDEPDGENEIEQDNIRAVGVRKRDEIAHLLYQNAGAA